MAPDIFPTLGWNSLNRAARLILSHDPAALVLIWGHDDPDGITATAILLKTLRRIFPRVEYYIPPRRSLHHGLDPATIDRYVPKGLGLLITVDCGISNYQEVSQARQRGLTVIVTDHHELPPRLPPAQAIVNPKIEEEGRPYPNLAGCGVALYLAAALSSEQGSLQVFQDPESISWAALGTVADRVPLRQENSLLVSRGLESLAACDWVRQACELAGFAPDSGLCPNILKETLIPLLAASESLGSKHENLSLLQGRMSFQRMAALWQKAQTLRQELAEQEAALRQRLDPSRDYYLLFAPGLKSEAIGILAGRLRDATGKPIIVLGKKGGFWVGEGRGFLPFDLVDLFRSLADLFIQYGGHKQAAGFTLAPGREDELVKRVGEEMQRRKSLLLPIRSQEPDYHVPDLPALLSLKEELKARFPLGPGNPEPQAAIDEFGPPPESLDWRGKWVELRKMLEFRAPKTAGPAAALLDITHLDSILIKILTE